MSNALAVEDTLHLDVSSVRSADARQVVRDAFEALGQAYHEIDGFGSSFSSGAHVPKHSLVCADLSSVVRLYSSAERLDWTGMIREVQPYILALIRTKRDESYLEWVDDLVRASDLRFSVCRFQAHADKQLRQCLAHAVSSLGPESILDVRYSRADDALWLEFGDGFSGTVRASDLGYEEADGLRLETAAVTAYRTAVQVFNRAGDIVDIDSEALRALLDERFALAAKIEAETASRIIGERLREERKRLGVSQTELSRRSGLDQAIISKIERGHHQPRWNTIERYARGLGTKPDLLLGSLRSGG
jgi:DNA-binding XRE family transcriptional regulator